MLQGLGCFCYLYKDLIRLLEEATLFFLRHLMAIVVIFYEDIKRLLEEVFKGL